MINKNIVELFYHQATKHANDLAIVDKETSITYGTLAIDVQKTVDTLRKKGIQKGHKVMVFVPMSIDLYRILLALFHIGAIPVFLDEWSSIKRLNEAAKIANCDCFISSWKGRLIAFAVSGLRKIKLKTSGDFNHNSSTQNEIEKIEKDDAIIITFSTGSTGTPKAAIRTYSMLYHQFEALKKYLDLDHTKVDMTSLPIVLLINLGLGKTSIIPNTNLRKLGEMNAANIHTQMINHKVSSLSCSPFFAEKYAEYILNNNHASSLEKIIIGGAPCYPKNTKKIVTAFSNADIRIVFGSTEAEPISSISAIELLNYSETQTLKGLPVGNIHQISEVRIIPISKEQVSSSVNIDSITLKPYEIGEIIVKGPHVLKNYLNNPSAENLNKIYLSDSFWHRTGDSGFLDENNQLFLTGRCHQLMKIKDHLVCPFLYEEKLGKIPNVEIATVLQDTNKLIAILELKDATKFLPIEKYIINSIPEIKKVYFIKKMPRDPRHHSKIDYEALKKKI